LSVNATLYIFAETWKKTPDVWRSFAGCW